MSDWDHDGQDTFTEQYHAYNEGRHFAAWRLLGALPLRDEAGFRFTVWAPRARMVRLVGDFNGWNGEGWEMECENGFWRRTVPGLWEGERYKFEVFGENGQRILHADPFARRAELRPATASLTWRDHYEWNDGGWMGLRKNRAPYDKPMLIYEVHAGSWQRGDYPTDTSDPDQAANGAFLTFRELADRLVPYVVEWGYTHIEFLPIQEYPFDGSWGYQLTGYYAPTSRHGTPEDFKYLVDKCHQANIGVILDWVPAHFLPDEHGLRLFDGTALYEYQDPRMREHKSWGTLVFDYGKGGVQSFLISNALYWIEEFHIDGLRVDAVTSMLYLDYDRKQGEWLPNREGGHINLEAVDLLRKLNKAVFESHPNALMIAEESTSYHGVTRPVHEGGLGFNYKWNMGWMNDTLKYMALDPVMRKGSHHAMTFSIYYAYDENYILSLSHDEVVHGKKSLLDKMSGDYESKFCSLRVYLLYMMTHPGKKLLFMGAEYGQFIEWRFYEALEFKLTAYPNHYKLWLYTKALNHFYVNNTCLYELDHKPQGFEWIDADDSNRSIFSYIRRGKHSQDTMLVILNMTPVKRENYWLGVPIAGTYEEIWNTDNCDFGGNGITNGMVCSVPGNCHNHSQYLILTLPPLAGICLRLIP